MSDQNEASSSVSSTVTAMHVEGNVSAGRDVRVKVINKIKKAKQILTSFRIFDLPTKNFTGRTNLLEKIHEQMMKCSKEEDFLDRIVVLSGLGGMGKSELARMYAKKYKDDPIIQNVAWIDAEKLKGMKASFVEVADTLGISTVDKNLETIVKNVYKHFSNHIKNGLFIFDNSKQMNGKPFGIYKYLPIQASIKHRPLLLLTARCNEWNIGNENNVIHINELSQEESIELLEKKFRLAEENEYYGQYKTLVAKLATSLQGYPLGLALATSNIKFNKSWTTLKTELDAYLERMEKPAGKWTRDTQRGAATNYTLIMNNVWEITLKNIKNFEKKGDNAIRLLNLIAYLPPDSIGKFQIEQIFQTCYSTSLSSEEFDVLEKYSLIKIETRKYWEVHEHVIRIHRLVQLTTRDKLDEEKNLSYLFGICKFFTYADYDSNYIDTSTLVGLHGFLKARKWQQDSIEFSLVFCSILNAKESLNDARTLAEDIHNFLSNGGTQALITKDKHFVNLFFLCKCWVNEINDGEKEWEEFNLDERERDSILISMIQPSARFALTYTRRPKSLEEHSFIKYMDFLPLVAELNLNVTRQLIPMIIETLDSTHWCIYKYVPSIHKFMWRCLDSKIPSSLTLFRPVFNTHLRISDSPYSLDEFHDNYDDLYHSLLDFNVLKEQLEDEKTREISNGKLRGFKATNG